MEFEDEGVVEGYQDLVNPKKKKQKVQCPRCDSYELTRVKRNLWICENCGLKVNDGDE